MRFNTKYFVMTCFVAIAKASPVSALCTSQDSPDSPGCNLHDSLRRSMPEGQRAAGCLELAVLGRDYNVHSVVEALNSIHEHSCGAKLCFFPDSGSIRTDDESVIVANLGSIDFLLVLNESNISPPMGNTTKHAVQDALASGQLQKLMIYDRFAGMVRKDVNVPGLNKRDVFRKPNHEQEPILLAIPPISGPAGTIGSHTGQSASHGYIPRFASILSDPRTEQHFRQPESREPPLGETTTIQYCYEYGIVYYSTIPMDYFFQAPVAVPPVFEVIFTNALCHIVASECNQSPAPYFVPSESPSQAPAVKTSTLPSTVPSDGPSFLPSREPSVYPSPSPTLFHSTGPTVDPTFAPSIASSDAPSSLSSRLPSLVPFNTAVEECQRWLSPCETATDCCSGICRRGSCRLFGVSNMMG